MKMLHKERWNMLTKKPSQTVGLSPRSQQSAKLKKKIAQKSGHQALIALGPEGFVKFCRGRDVNTQLKAARYWQHLPVQIYGVWWCENEQAAEQLKKEVERHCREVFPIEDGAGYFQMPVADEMVDKVVCLAAAHVGVMSFSDALREEWLVEQVKKYRAHQFQNVG